MGRPVNYQQLLGHLPAAHPVTWIAVYPASAAWGGHAAAHQTRAWPHRHARDPGWTAGYAHTGTPVPA
jgi:hypothetical protein